MTGWFIKCKFGDSYSDLDDLLIYLYVPQTYFVCFRKPYEKDAVTRKTEKVMRFKAKKSLETKLKDLFTKLNLDHVDDDTKVWCYLFPKNTSLLFESEKSCEPGWWVGVVQDCRRPDDVPKCSEW